MLRDIPRPVTVCALVLAIGIGCQSDASEQRATPRARAEDPVLTHSWSVPAEASQVVRGDLGSEPPELADALMQGGTMPSLVHAVGKACSDRDALGPDVGQVALRLVWVEGRLESVRGDPRGPAADCLAAGLADKGSSLSELPTGMALLRLELAPSPKST